MKPWLGMFLCISLAAWPMAMVRASEVSAGRHGACCAGHRAVKPCGCCDHSGGQEKAPQQQNPCGCHPVLVLMVIPGSQATDVASKGVYRAEQDVLLPSSVPAEVVPPPPKGDR